jgi:hypothetical protein
VRIDVVGALHPVHALAHRQAGVPRSAGLSRFLDDSGVKVRNRLATRVARLIVRGNILAATICLRVLRDGGPYTDFPQECPNVPTLRTNAFFEVQPHSGDFRGRPNHPYHDGISSWIPQTAETSPRNFPAAQRMKSFPLDPGRGAGNSTGTRIGVLRALT